MRRAALTAGVLAAGVFLVWLMHTLGRISRSPQITYGELPGALFIYDQTRDLSAPLVRQLDKLPVAWSWSPDGSQLAYVLLDQLSGGYDIYVWHPHARQPVELVRGLPFGAPPQWSPDGTRIAAVDASQDICLYPVSTGDTTCLNVQPAGLPTWSPDGNALAYLSRLPDGGLLRVDAGTGLVTPLFTGVSGLNNPRWSPEGSLIVFSYQPQLSGERHLYIVPSSGGSVRALTADGSSWQDQPVWSPDGQFIAYNDYPANSRNQTDVAVVEVETGEITRVTTHPMIDTDPRWSPDGAQLAFVSDRFDSRPQLHIIETMRLSNAEPLTLPGVAMRLYAYAWRP